MRKLSTFEDVFNRIHQEYLGQWVEIEVRINKVKLSHLAARLTRCQIKQLKEGILSGSKKGVIILKGRIGRREVELVQIPFELGINTMTAYFIKSGAAISSLGFDFKIRKLGQAEIKNYSA
ncbi:MAG: hypothetical protein UMV23_03095 [Halanaerobium sp.]|nr:hypothetical protein [Halanaerobium sp.]